MTTSTPTQIPTLVQTRLVQTTVVKPSTHFETVAVTAIASGLLLARADVEEDPWRTWLDSSYTKTVRRVKRPIDLERVRALGLPNAEITLGDAVAIAFVPSDPAQNPREISRLQVSGLDLAGDDTQLLQAGLFRPRAATARIEINSDVTMSTGKTAAQAAHAVCSWLLTQDDQTRLDWAREPGISLSAVSFSRHPAEAGELEVPVTTIVDNGLTEIPAGTATARVYLARHA
ncbi:peptidyl-tRNA hydrolase [Cryobacterium luteum]|uniref:peptidyl-tRNA hydrolase n=1 Tax=Cryobacterium luteum TaxID=1424661 RepID=A0A1H8L021_9MICO|nr:peptidyl-tRNA hydrolase [Cryobacterium luteum]TFB82336.1 hypothetical protein E3O10_17690 [Cryobacterium luteum]SEN98520.1 Peptidyl-tRNA hydrolase [Cryobacterium luteum]